MDETCPLCTGGRGRARGSAGAGRAPRHRERGTRLRRSGARRPPPFRLVKVGFSHSRGFFVLCSLFSHSHSSAPAPAPAPPPPPPPPFARCSKTSSGRPPGGLGPRRGLDFRRRRGFDFRPRRGLDFRRRRGLDFRRGSRVSRSAGTPTCVAPESEAVGAEGVSLEPLKMRN